MWRVRTFSFTDWATIARRRPKVYVGWHAMVIIRNLFGVGERAYVSKTF